MGFGCLEAQRRVSATQIVQEMRNSKVAPVEDKRRAERAVRVLSVRPLMRRAKKRASLTSTPLRA